VLLRNRSLGATVAFGFASLLVMLAALIALAIREVDVAQDQRREIASALKLAEAADRLALDISRADSALRSFILGRASEDLRAAQQYRETARLAATEVQRQRTNNTQSRRLADLVVQAAARWDGQAVVAETQAQRLRPELLIPFQRQYLDEPTDVVLTAADDLRVGLTQKVDDIEERLSRRGDRLTQALILGFGLAGVVGILLGVYFVRLVTEPLARMVAVADAVRAGDYAMARRLVADRPEVATRPSDNEITLLTQTLAQMAETLDEREQHLRSHAASLAEANRMLAALQSLADAALSELTLEDLLEQLLQRIVSGLDGQAGILFLRHATSGRLEPRVMVGERAGGESVSVSSAEEFAESIVEQGALVVVPDQAVAESHPFLVARAARAFLAGPICVNGELAGLAYVEFREPRSFEPPQEHLMQVFVERLERAMERAQSSEEAAAWQHDLERRVAQQQDQLVRTERLASIGLVGGSIAHELRNPLGVISNSIYFLRHRLTPGDEKIQRHLEIISLEVEHATRIINNLVDFSTAIEPVTTRVDLNSLIEAALEAVRVPPQIEVQLELVRPLPTLLGDETQLLQVFEHLIRNAVQALEGGGRLRIVTESDGARVRAAVEDTGPGISPQDQVSIFEPLVSTRAKGMGLGLTLSRRIVEAHGGEVRVVSKLGQGSTFTVELPVSEVLPPSGSDPSVSVSAEDAAASRTA
jgi:signal transduction histidine kinase